MTDFKLTALAHALPSSVPFVGPETQERARGEVFAARLGANENVFGPSPKAVRAMQDAVTGTWMYGDPESFDLIEALSTHLNIGTSNIIVGEGIDGLLGYICRLFLDVGDAVVTSDGAYPTFNYHVSGFGGQLHKVPFKDDREDPDALLTKARETGAKLIYISNPDNPMGTWHDAATMQAMIDNVPEGCLLILDEAYLETAPAGTAPALRPDTPQVIRMRTFSKAYGMAGARVGYGIGHPDLINSFHKIRNHFGLNRIAQIGAIAALEDREHLSDVLKQTAQARDALSQIARDVGLEALPSATNFVTIDCGRDGFFATNILNALVERGLFLRMPFVAPQNRCIRVGCSTPEHLSLLHKHLADVLSKLR
ncbi:MAG: pyridoxal phosphate-dependent aminotransferase [Litoreibacter sp.]